MTAVPNVRVLVVHGTVTMRRLLTDVLSSEPDIEVVGSAPNGMLAVAQIPLVDPGVVLMSATAPRADVLDALAAIRKAFPALPVLVLSPLTSGGATVALEALRCGANDCVTQPGAYSVGGPIQCLRDELMPAIRRWGRRSAGQDWSRQADPTAVGRPAGDATASLDPVANLSAQRHGSARASTRS